MAKNLFALLIKDLSAFLRFRYGPNSREHKFVCFKCLKGTHSLASMNAHRYLCTNTYTQFEEMPPKNSYVFWNEEKYDTKYDCELFCFLNFESILTRNEVSKIKCSECRLSTCKCDTPATYKTNKHEPNMYVFSFLCFKDKKLLTISKNFLGTLLLLLTQM